jgi:hypothetical protein
MARDLLSPSVILDETPAAVRRAAAPGLGVLWLTTIPLHLLQAAFFREVFRLGAAAEEYGDHLSGYALAALVALLPATWGRAVFVRGCLLGLQSGGAVGREAFRVPGAVLVSSLYLGLIAQAFFYASVWSYVTIPIGAILSGLAAVAAHRVERPGLLRPIRELGAAFGHPKPILAMLFAYGVGFLVAFLNVYLLLVLAVWAAGGVSGADLSRWEYLVRSGTGVSIAAESLTRWIVLAGAVTFVEPFWLASFAVLVHRSKLRETGEDLRLWFHRLTRTG